MHAAKHVQTHQVQVIKQLHESWLDVYKFKQSTDSDHDRLVTQQMHFE